jgi:hypothetical protein
MKCMTRITVLVVALCLTADAAAAKPVPRGAPLFDPCGPGDRVVWLNVKSGIYYLKGDPSYGRSAGGHFMCQEAADHEGDEAAVVSSDD